MKVFLAVWLLSGYITVKALIAWKVAAFVIVGALVFWGLVTEACLKGEDSE